MKIKMGLKNKDEKSNGYKKIKQNEMYGQKLEETIGTNQDAKGSQLFIHRQSV